VPGLAGDSLRPHFPSFEYLPQFASLISLDWGSNVLTLFPRRKRFLSLMSVDASFLPRMRCSPSYDLGASSFASIRAIFSGSLRLLLVFLRPPTPTPPPPHPPHLQVNGLPPPRSLVALRYLGTSPPPPPMPTDFFFGSVLVDLPPVSVDSHSFPARKKKDTYPALRRPLPSLRTANYVRIDASSIPLRSFLLDLSVVIPLPWNFAQLVLRLLASKPPFLPSQVSMPILPLAQTPPPPSCRFDTFVLVSEPFSLVQLMNALQSSVAWARAHNGSPPKNDLLKAFTAFFFFNPFAHGMEILIASPFSRSITLAIRQDPSFSPYAFLFGRRSFLF